MCAYIARFTATTFLHLAETPNAYSTYMRHTIPYGTLRSFLDYILGASVQKYPSHYIGAYIFRLLCEHALAHEREK